MVKVGEEMYTEYKEDCINLKYKVEAESGTGIKRVHFEANGNELYDVGSAKGAKQGTYHFTSNLYFWSGGCGIVFALLNSCLIFCAWPQNHIFLVPSAWYEFMTSASIGFIGLFAASLILNCEIWMDINEIKTWRNLLYLYLFSACAWLLANTGYYHIYSGVLELRPPMPLNIHVCGTFTLISALSFLWILIPSDVRSRDMFWNRYWYYALAQIYRYVAVLQYFVLSWLFVVIPRDYQPVIAIMLPIVRSINGRLLTAICYKAAGTKNNDAILVTCKHEMGCRHAVFLSVAISILATRESASLALGFDVAVNFVICLKIIWRTKRQKKVLETKDDTDLQVYFFHNLKSENNDFA